MKSKPKEKLNAKEILENIKKRQLDNHEYVVMTDKGYLIGDVVIGVTFTQNKQEGRRFNYSEAVAYKDSIFADITEFYGCSWMEFQKI